MESIEIGSQTIEAPENEPENKGQKTTQKNEAVKSETIPHIPLWRKLFPKVRNKNFFRNIMLGVLAATFILTIVMFFVWHIDGLLVPSTLVGTVLDHKNQPLKGVKVFINNNEATETDANGKFTIIKSYGNYKFVFKYDKFADFNLNVDIARGDNEIKINMTPNAIGDVTIKFIAPSGNVNTDNMDIEFDGKPYQLDSKSEVVLDSYPVGTYKLVVTSPVYYDIHDEMQVKAIANSAEVQLVAAWDVKIKLQDWLIGKPLDQTKATFDGIKFETDKDGVFAVNDIIKTDQIKLTTSRIGYLNKETLIKKADLQDGVILIEMVREGKALYLSNRTGNSNIYLANYDGSEEIRLTDDKGDSYAAQMINGTTSQIKFLSNRDKVRDINNQLIALPYAVNLDGSGLTKLAKTNYSDYKSIGTYNFLAAKRMFLEINTTNTGDSVSSIFFGPLDGSSSKLLLENKANTDLSSFIIANDGSFILFVKNYYEQSDENGIYYLNTQTKAVQKIYGSSESIVLNSIAPDNKSVIANIFDIGQDRSDLWKVNLDGKTALKLTNSSATEYSAEFLNANTIVYLSDRDNKTELFAFDIAKKTEIQLTKDGSIDNFVINKDGLISYFSKQTLWIIDPANPAKAQKITTNVLNDV